MDLDAVHFVVYDVLDAFFNRRVYNLQHWKNLVGSIPLLHGRLVFDIHLGAFFGDGG